MQGNMVLERADKHSYRILLDGKIIGFAISLSNERWGAFNENERPIQGVSFTSPKGVLDHFQRHFAKDAAND